MSPLSKKAQPAPVSQLLAPKHWPTWLGIGLLQLVVRMPYRVQLVIGRATGWLFRRINPYRRNVVRTNLTLCFPELGADERLQLEKACYSSLGCSLIETATGLWGAPRLFEKYGFISGLEHLESAAKKGKGVILFSGHFCSVDFAGRVLLQHYPVSYTYQEVRNPVFNRLIPRLRGKYIDNIIHRHNTRGFIKALRAGEVIWYAPDQDQSRKNSVFAPFFGIPTNTLTATTKLVKLTGAAVLPLTVERLPDARGYSLSIQPALENFPGDNEEADATRTNALIESQAREHPEQYLWLHRRFKTRPRGEPKLYPQKPRRVRRAKRKQRKAAP